MAEYVTVCNLSENDLQLKHKKERKELQNKILGLKKACAKGDKKKKKELAEEIVLLEAELDRRQALEAEHIKKFDVEVVTTAVDSIDISQDHSREEDKASAGLRLSKAQKRRDKKIEKDKERDFRIAQQEEKNKFGPRHLEKVKIRDILTAKKLTLYEVPSDGNCLYSSIAHQLIQQGEPNKASVPLLRGLTSSYLRDHEEDLRPFTCNPSTGLELTQEEYSEYCNRTESDSSAWGGQLELQALSETLKKPIEVLQAEGCPVLLGEKYHPLPPLVLTYHRYSFGLGEHYNSVATQP